MMPSEANALLTIAGSLDNRTPSAAAAKAWAETLHPSVTLEDGKAIIYAHYATESRWIMPADINTGSAKIRAERIELEARTGDPIAPPESIDPDDPATEARWKRAYWAAIGDGLDRQAADLVACEVAGVRRPLHLTAPRPVQAALDGHKATCRCGCLTRPLTARERAS